MGGIEAPKPLNDEELMECFRLYGITGDIKYRDYIFVHNIREVLKLIRRKYYMYDENDMLSYGLEGLFNAVENFDINRGNKFSTFAHYCICHEIIKYIEYNGRVRRIGNVVSLYEKTFNSSDIEALTYLDITPDNKSKEEEEKIELMLAINNFLLTLSDREKRMFEMEYGINGYQETTQLAMESIFGVKHQRIDQINKRTLRDLKTYLISSGYTIDGHVPREYVRKRRIRK